MTGTWKSLITEMSCVRVPNIILNRLVAFTFSAASSAQIRQQKMCRQEHDRSLSYVAKWFHVTIWALLGLWMFELWRSGHSRCKAVILVNEPCIICEISVKNASLLWLTLSRFDRLIIYQGSVTDILYLLYVQLEEAADRLKIIQMILVFNSWV